MFEEKIINDLLEKDYNIYNINQLLKTKENGYDLCNINIKIPHEKIKEFIVFLEDNIEPGLDKKQLCEIYLGWMKGLNVYEYSDKKYSAKEMSILRKALENKKNVNLIKKYGKNEEEMLEISRAIGFGCNEDDFKKYSIKELKLFNDYQKKKIDLRRLLDKGFNKEQIDYILQFEKIDKNFASYITKNFHYTTIMALGHVLEKYPYETIKPLFNSYSSMPLISTYENLLDRNIDGWEKYYQPQYYEKTLLIANLLINKETENLINKVYETNFSKYRYDRINCYYNNGKNKLPDFLFDEKIDDEQIAYETYKINKIIREKTIDELIKEGKDLEKNTEIKEINIDR